MLRIRDETPADQELMGIITSNLAVDDRYAHPFYCAIAFEHPDFSFYGPPKGKIFEDYVQDQNEYFEHRLIVDTSKYKYEKLEHTTGLSYGFMMREHKMFKASLDDPPAICYIYQPYWSLWEKLKHTERGLIEKILDYIEEDVPRWLNNEVKSCRDYDTMFYLFNDSNRKISQRLFSLEIRCKYRFQCCYNCNPFQSVLDELVEPIADHHYLCKSKIALPQSNILTASFDSPIKKQLKKRRNVFDDPEVRDVKTAHVFASSEYGGGFDWTDVKEEREDFDPLNFTSKYLFVRLHYPEGFFFSGAQADMILNSSSQVFFDYIKTAEDNGAICIENRLPNLIIEYFDLIACEEFSRNTGTIFQDQDDEVRKLLIQKKNIILNKLTPLHPIRKCHETHILVGSVADAYKEKEYLRRVGKEMNNKLKQLLY